MKRFLILLLAVAMFIPCLAACGKKQEPESKETTTAQSEGDEISQYDSEGYLNDSLPADLDYKDEEIKILYWNNGELGEGEFDPKDDEKGTIERSVYERNKITEERLNVSLKWTGIAGDWNNRNNFLNTVTMARAGGESTRFDLIAGYSQTMATLATQGLTLDLMASSKYLDLGKPWWPDSLVDDLTISGKLYFASGDISTSFIATMLSVFVNKSYYPSQNLYDLVYNDEWTLDTMFEMVKDQGVADDIEPDKKDLRDRFGLVVGWTSYLDGFFYGSDLITVDHSENGELHVNSAYVGEKADALCEKLKQFFRSDDAWMPSYTEPDEIHKGVIDNLFAVGRSAMMVGTGTTILSYPGMRDTEVDYAVLPMPKYDEDQKDYKSVNLNLYTLWSIFAGSDAEQAKRAGAVMECLGSTGYRKVTPVVFDRCLKLRYAKDGDTGRMYDIIRAGVVFDPGRIFSAAALSGIPQDKWQRDGVILNGVWGAQSTVVDSQLQDKLDALCEAFRNNETLGS